MSSMSKAKRSAGGGLQGPRPQPLSLTATTPPPPKKPRFNTTAPAAGPVIVYERTPRVVHARPDEFMTVVQRLTGRQHPPSPQGAAAGEEARDNDAADSLVLTLGQQQQRPPSSSSSPGSFASATSLVSPGSFIFSPATMQAIREIIS